MKARIGGTLAVQIPYRGMSSRYPLAKMPPEFAPWVENFDIGAGILETPLGMKFKFTGVTNYVSCIAQDPSNKDQIVHLDISGAAIKCKVYNIFTNTAGSTYTAPHAATGSRAQAVGFNDNVYFFCQRGAPVIFTGSALNAVGFTGPTLANLVGGAVYNSGLYCFEENSASVWYSPSAGAVAGAFNEYDLKYITSDNGKVIIVTSFTLSSGLDSQVLWCVVMDTGEVLTFSGIRPDDTEWAQRGRAIIAAPVGYQSFIEANGDVLIITKQGIVSLRELFTSAQGNLQAASITYEIEKYWTQLCQDIEAFNAPTSYDLVGGLLSFITGAYHQIKNKLVIFCPRTLKPSTVASGEFGYDLSAGSMALIYDFTTQSWVARTFSGIPEVATYQLTGAYYHPKSNSLLIGTNSPTDESCWQMWGNTAYEDGTVAPALEQVSINARIISAPIALQDKLQLKGFKVLSAGHSSSKTSAAVKARADIGARETGSASLTLASGVSNDLYNVGVTSEFIQYDLSVSTNENADRPYQLLNISAIVEQGGVLG